MVKFKTRAIAYIIDIVILSIIVSLVQAVIPKSSNHENLLKELEEVQEKVIKNEITVDKYINQTIDINYQLSKENVIYVVIDIIFILLYFVILPFYNDGATIGKRKCGIKVVGVNKDLTINDLIIRNFIINGLLQMLLSLSVLYILPSTSYFLVTIFLSLGQFILLIVTIAFMLKSKDGRGLQDIWTNTKIIEVKE
ncbi:MAG: RDD family protein [Bacilli bacterium]|nr:RDD family protein [Bacilli bacterium]MDD4733866.1 RDD family protein [Bacilli bacterium]